MPTGPPPPPLAPYPPAGSVHELINKQDELYKPLAMLGAEAGVLMEIDIN